MKDKNDADAGPMGRPESPATDEYAAAPRNGRSTGLDHRPANGHPPGGNLNIWLALDVLANRWHWLVIGFMLGGTALGYLAWTYIQPRFTATAQLLRIEPPDFFKAGVTPETFSGLIRSRELLDRVGKQ